MNKTLQNDVRLDAVQTVLVIALVAVLSVVLTSCAGSAKVPEDHFYRLPVITLSANGDAPQLSGRIEIEEPETDGLYRERSIMYLDVNRPLEIKQYHYRHWMYRPGLLVQQYLLEYFQKRYPDKPVIKYTASGNADNIIGGRVVRFERVIGNSQTEILVELKLHLKKNKNSLNSVKPEVLHEEIYSRKIIAKGNSFHTTAEVFGEALQQIFQQFSTDAVESLK